MTKSTLILLSLLFLYSCKTAIPASSEVPFIDTSYSVSVCNTPYKIEGMKQGVPNLLGTFEIYHVESDSISLHFSHQDTLIITYLDSHVIKVKKLKGRFDSKGYFEIHLHNESIEIPPLIPILYSRHNINKVRLFLSADRTLVVDNKWLQGGNILILGAGDSGRRQSYFKTYPLKLN